MANPFWFQRALDTHSESGDVDVDGARIHYEAWGEVGAPGVVLIHGSNAHLEWWRFVAPFLADQFRVVALDSSGNGDSGWRDRYDGETLAREVWAVCESAQLGPNPFVVGHSFGGFVALETGHQFGAQLGGIIFMDFTVAPPEQYVEWGLRMEREEIRPKRKLRVHEDLATAKGRFRLIPEQPINHPDVLDYLCEHSLKQVPGGWTWKFDPSLFDYLEMGTDQCEKFVGLACRSAVILGENSDDEGAFFGDHMASITGGKLPIFKVPGTHHHLMFDEPVAVAMSIKSLLLDWIREDGSEILTRALANAGAIMGTR
jgi:pimeloyl-ACP methyl ester carboxylesterase